MVNITSTNNGVSFAFTDSQYYLFGTGEINVPLNALSLVIDQSDMVTFKKAASDDVFISVPLDQTNFATKAALISFYKENMVGGNAEMTEAFTGVSYDAEAQELIFTNIDDEEVATLDVSAFVLDGMLDNVEVENGYLVFTFNTASGKETISIPLTSFFDASQYYTKTDIEDILNPKEQAIAEALTELHETKADKTEIPTVPTNVSSFNNDAGYITTSVNDLANYYDKNYIDITVGDINTILQSI